ncbi:MAG: dipeptidase [Gemmatimonadota bacterium]
MTRIPVLDGHNDTLTQIRNAPAEARRTFLVRSELGHVDLARAQEGGLAGGFFAIFTPSPGRERVRRPRMDAEGRAVPGAWVVEPARRVSRRSALTYTLAVLSDLFRLERDAAGSVAVVRSVSELERCLENGTLAVIAHVEGAEAIDTRMEALDVLHAAGLRSLGPVWSRPNAFGTGVPFDFPGSPDIGPGLSAAGRRLIKACARLGVLVDLSHLNERGFWDVSRLHDAPLVATHSAVHALCPSPRNLTDAQLDAIGASGGLVGINFHTGFLRADGDAEQPTSLQEIVRHARYVADRIGLEHVALGSDFDGAVMPVDLQDVTGLPRLLQAFRDAGFHQSDLEGIAHRNWVRVLRQIWGDA